MSGSGESSRSEGRFAGVRVPDPGFAGDAGAVDADVAAALRTALEDPRRRAEALLVLQDSRVLVPVLAVADEVEVDDRGLARDKSSDMATVLLTGADGRRALLAFTGAGPLAAWDAAARPVPVTARTAAQAAVQEGADALLVDLAGPATFVVQGEDLVRLAAGWVLVRVEGGLGWLAGGLTEG